MSNKNKLPNAEPDKRDAVEAYLQDEYKVPAEDSAAYAGRLSKENDTTVTSPALARVAENEKERLARINHYVDIAKRFYAGEPVDKEDMDYFHAVHNRTAQIIQNKAKGALAMDKLKGQTVIAPEQGDYGHVDTNLYNQYKDMMGEAEQDRGADAQFQLENRKPTVEQRINTIRNFRPGMTILDNQAGLSIPVRRKGY